MRVTCAQLFGIILLVNTVLIFLVSISTPFWVVHSSSEEHQGLMAYCADECTWFFQHDFELFKKMPDWFKATQGLIASGLVADVIALIVAVLAACTKCYSCNPHRITAAFLLLSFISTLIGIVVYCVKANNEWDVTLSEGSDKKFGWSLWLCVGSTALAFCTFGIFACAGRKNPDDYY